MADAVTFTFGSRKCPLCESEQVTRSRRRGLIESFFLPIFLFRPYRCKECGARHLGFILRPRVVSALGDEEDER